MLGFLKNWLNRPDLEAPPQGNLTSSHRPPYSAASGKHIPQAPPQPAASIPPSHPPSPPAHAQPGPSRRNQNNQESIRLRLGPILEKLPDAVRALMALQPNPDTIIAIPLKFILPQLPKGVVRASVDELSQWGPPGLFRSTDGADQTTISLPLNNILAELDPALLARRPGARQLEVPQDITNVFKRGQFGVQHPAEPEPSNVAPPDRAAGSPRRNVSGTPSTPIAPAPSSPQAAPPAPTSPPSNAAGSTEHPAAPGRTSLDLIRSSIPLPLPGKSTSPAAAGPPTPPSPRAPASPTIQLNSTAQPVSRKAPAPPAHSAPQEDANDTTRFHRPFGCPLRAIMNGWPDSITSAIGDASKRSLALTFEMVEPGLQRGKLLFSWKELRPRIRPPLPPNFLSEENETLLNLPLSVVAPMALRIGQPLKPQSKVPSHQEIPDLFAVPDIPPPASVVQEQQAQLAAEQTPILEALPQEETFAPEPEPMEAPPPAPQPAPSEASPVFPEGKQDWSPKEIVQQASALPGVAGALVVMSDGMLVAGQLPQGLDTEMAAAFLPQAYNRTMVFCKGVKLGCTTHLLIQVGEAPLAIYPCGEVFFAVIGEPHQTLPGGPLTEMAAYLAARKPF